ncbi:MAG: hypothetical protein PHW39_06130, partial [Syntrophomonadaceae bacterium]|nr:hypothetical protein [Syntrophomonadaceae bacterium]
DAEGRGLLQDLRGLLIEFFRVFPNGFPVLFLFILIQNKSAPLIATAGSIRVPFGYVVPLGFRGFRVKV